MARRFSLSAPMTAMLLTAYRAKRSEIIDGSAETRNALIRRRLAFGRYEDLGGLNRWGNPNMRYCYYLTTAGRSVAQQLIEAR